ncbi:MAG: hypothetical protein QF819_09260 [Gemmatimonadota bacterium]|jgi:hypothetical protein|nr:hypothetical protein [Gemmatimonadota bacterium]MDP6803338.1 hypothetical protein [Gemmatimonadota bacterium]MDP7031480.1 hypothetical protein [Gemmatimonadota bacterium]
MPPLRKSTRTVLLALLVSAAGTPSSACPGCGGGGNERNRGAFTASTLLLTGLPLAMIGGSALWLRRRLDDGEDETPAR